MNISRVLTRTARTHPTLPAIRYDDRTWTYAQLDARVGRLAGALRGLGMVPGDRVMLFQRNQPALLESHLACLRAGLVSVPVNFRLHPEEAAFVADDAGASVLVHAPEFADVAEACRAARPGLLTVPTGEDGADSPEYARLVDGDEQLADVDVDDDHPAWLFYTSGTTGRPKGAVMAHRVLWAVALNFACDIDRVRPGDVFLHAAPLTHGSGIFTLPGIVGGACHVIQHTRSFDTDVTLELVERHGVTHLPFLAPTMVNRLVDRARTSRASTRSLRVAIYGGAPMYVEDARRAIDVLGPVWTQVYGQGEAPTISRLPASEHRADSAEARRRLGSAGTPRVNVDVVVTDEAGTPVAVGEDGEIRVRGPVVMSGYWRDPEATAAALEGGWLRTGDLGMLDESGHLHVTGRSKDMIISGGVNIYPREIEEVLLRHPAVSEVAVIGVPDREWGESVRAVVVLHEDATEDQLVHHCLSHLAGYKRPRSIVRTDALPTTAYGKVSKRDVAERFGDTPTPTPTPTTTSPGATR